MSQSDFIFKINLLGPGGAGKTAIVDRLKTNLFFDQFKITIGVDFSVVNLKIKGYNIKFQIWDHGGQERFWHLYPLSFKGSLGAILISEITDEKIFKKIEDYYQMYRKVCLDTPVILVGNKIDLINEWDIPENLIEELKKKLNAPFFLVSAKTGQNVKEIFEKLGELILEHEGILKAEEIKNKNKNDLHTDLSSQTQISNIEKEQINKITDQAKLIKFNINDLEIISRRLFRTNNLSKYIGVLKEVITDLLTNLNHKNIFYNVSNVLSLFRSVKQKLIPIISVNYSFEQPLESDLFRELLINIENNLKLDYVFKEIAMEIYVIIGTNSLNQGDLKRSGLSFYKASEIIAEENLELAIKLFTAATILLSISDYDFFINNLLKSASIFMSLETLDKERVNVVIEKILMYFDICASFINVFDESIYDIDVLKPIEIFLQKRKEENGQKIAKINNNNGNNGNNDNNDIALKIDQLLAYIIEKGFQELQTMINPVRIISIETKPKVVEENTPIILKIKLINILKNHRKIICEIKSSGTSFVKDSVKLRINGRSEKEVLLMAGKTLTTGNLAFLINLKSPNNYLQYSRIFQTYIPEPDENLRIDNVIVVPNEIKEDIPVFLLIYVKNKGHMQENIELHVDSVFFENKKKNISLKISASETQEYKVDLGTPTKTGLASVEIDLIHKKSGKLCDKRVLDVNIKKSWKLLLKKGTKTGLNTLLNIL